MNPNPGPRVLFVIPGEAQGSSMVFARRQAEALIARGVAVEPFYLRSRTSLRILIQEALRFRQLQERVQPDLVHAHFGTITALFTVLAARVPVVITYRGSDLNFVPSSSGLRARFGRLLSQMAALGASRIVCVSSKLRSQLWWGRARTAVLPSGVDTAAFYPVPRAEARRELGWDDAPVVLFNAGHDARNKRLDLVQAAMEVLKQSLPSARAVVLHGEIAPHRLPLFLNAADCLLVTSDAEGSPTIVQEAIATNLPVVSVDVGDVAERLRGISETAIAPRDPHALAAALSKILVARNRSNGRLRIREIDSSHIADELTHLYLEIVAAESPWKVSLWNTTLSLLR